MKTNSSDERERAGRRHQRRASARTDRVRASSAARRLSRTASSAPAKIAPMRVSVPKYARVGDDVRARTVISSADAATSTAERAQRDLPRPLRDPRCDERDDDVGLHLDGDRPQVPDERRTSRLREVRAALADQVPVRQAERATRRCHVRGGARPRRPGRSPTHGEHREQDDERRARSAATRRFAYARWSIAPVLRCSSRSSDVSRKPDRTKNISTPRNPPGSSDGRGVVDEHGDEREAADAVERADATRACRRRRPGFGSGAATTVRRSLASCRCVSLPSLRRRVHLAVRQRVMSVVCQTDGSSDDGRAVATPA